jgi:hypothetical protein
MLFNFNDSLETFTSEYLMTILFAEEMLKYRYGMYRIQIYGTVKIFHDVNKRNVVSVHVRQRITF